MNICGKPRVWQAGRRRRRREEEEGEWEEGGSGRGPLLGCWRTRAVDRDGARPARARGGAG